MSSRENKTPTQFECKMTEVETGSPPGKKQKLASPQGRSSVLQEIWNDLPDDILLNDSATANDASATAVASGPTSNLTAAVVAPFSNSQSAQNNADFLPSSLSGISQNAAATSSSYSTGNIGHQQPVLTNGSFLGSSSALNSVSGVVGNQMSSPISNAGGPLMNRTVMYAPFGGGGVGGMPRPGGGVVSTGGQPVRHMVRIHHNSLTPQLQQQQMNGLMAYRHIPGGGGGGGPPSYVATTRKGQILSNLQMHHGARMINPTPAQKQQQQQFVGVGGKRTAPPPAADAVVQWQPDLAAVGNGNTSVNSNQLGPHISIGIRPPVFAQMTQPVNRPLSSSGQMTNFDPQCASSRQIITHWKTCQRPDCIVCLPLKQASSDRRPTAEMAMGYDSASALMLSVGGSLGLGLSPSSWTSSLSNVGGQQQHQQQRRAIVSSGSGHAAGDAPMQQQQQHQMAIAASLTNGPFAPSAGVDGCTGSAQSSFPRSTSNEEWHRELQPGLRDHFVQKIIQVIVTNAAVDVYKNNKRYESFVTYANKAEAYVYSIASSKENYYKLLAEKIYKIQRAWEDEIRNQRRRQLNKCPDGAGGSGQLSAQQNSPAGSPNDRMSNQENIANQRPYSGLVDQNLLLAGPGSAGGVHLMLPSASSINNCNDVEPPGSTTESSNIRKEETPNASPPKLFCGGPINDEADSARSASSPSLMRSNSRQQRYANARSNMNGAVITADADSITRKQRMKSSDAEQHRQTRSRPGTAGSTHHRQRPKQPPPAIPPNRKAFRPDELRDALMPTLGKLYQHEDSYPFREPVDPHALNVPDYFSIIRSPMDLSTIRRKLESGQYQDPWGFVDDVLLMFENAWTYNKRTSKVYKCTTKLCDIFEDAIDPVMQSLGYCCGRKYTFQPQVLCCYGRQLCTIPHDTNYFCYQNRYTYCERCFNEIPGDSVELCDDPSQSPEASIAKSQFEKCKNDHVQPESMVECKVCARKLHQICVLHMDQIWPGGFVCEGCRTKASSNSAPRKENRFTAKRLQHNRLSEYVEERVNAFLAQNDCEGGPIAIRVLSSCEKQVQVKPLTKQRYVDNNLMNESFPYRAKAIFAFQTDFDGTELCFFGMHVQEYDSNCPAPNARRVYIAYLDSVFYFKPKERRTDVYHEILLAYLSWAKQLGYVYGHIWACPPSEGDDYVFRCHPPEQKTPKPKRLQEWYRKMLDRGISEDVVHDYKDIATQASDENLKYAYELPYFDGDFWPNVLEECIKELDDQAQEEEQKQRRLPEPESAQMNNKKKLASKKKSVKPHRPDNQDLVSGKVLSTMERHKEVFFVVRLHNNQTAAQLESVIDPDPPVVCELMDGRDAFLTLAREKHLEFSSLRRAKFSSMAMLYELHTGGGGADRFVYTCNNCRSQVETRYHCRECDDYDLCVPCYNKLSSSHQHVMDKIGLDLDEAGESAGGSTNDQPSMDREQLIARWIESLVHACQCKQTSCRQAAACQRMKHVLIHATQCTKTKRRGCSICKQLLALCCAHAKTCKEQKCPVPLCAGIKQRIREQTVQRQIQQEQLVRRRMATMNRPHMKGASSAAHTQ